MTKLVPASDQRNTVCTSLTLCNFSGGRGLPKRKSVWQESPHPRFVTSWLYRGIIQTTLWCLPDLLKLVHAIFLLVDFPREVNSKNSTNKAGKTGPTRREWRDLHLFSEKQKTVEGNGQNRSLLAPEKLLQEHSDQFFFMSTKYEEIGLTRSKEK